MTTQNTPVPRLRLYQGPAVLSYGFRPFSCSARLMRDLPFWPGCRCFWGS